MSLYATTPVPSPLAVVGVVSNDWSSRTLTVRISDNERGFPRLCWKEAYAALRRSEQSGWRTGQPTIWAGTDSADKVASATPGDNTDNGRLVFSFAPGQQAYTQLVGKPGLTAFVILDRSTHRFLSVKFRHQS
jgi:hypothetical protein